MMRLFGMLVVATWVLLLPATHARSGPSKALDSATVHVRSVKSPEHLLTLLAGAAHERGITDVHIAFDGISFAPPPGENEFSRFAALDGDFDRWLDALRRWGPPAGLRAEVFGTLRGRAAAIEPGLTGWQSRLRHAARYAWWADEGFETFEPARDWMRRWLEGVPRGRRAMLVLITGTLTPERWVSRGATANRHIAASLPWRRKLREVGSYWDEEAIGRLLRDRGVPLMVVAPEATFEDHHPVPELPSMPWVGRPEYPPPSTTSAVRSSRGGPTTGRSRERETSDGLRFRATTPTWFWRQGNELLFSNDTPSGYGYWPYARAAAVSHGRYFFYPHAPARWLDVCPRDVYQLDRMAPALSTRKALVRERAGDRLLDAICRACRAVTADTPWTDDATLLVDSAASARGNAFRLPDGVGFNRHWSGHVTAGRKNTRYRARRKPWNCLRAGHPDRERESIRAVGRRLLALAPKYDRALEKLQQVLAKADPSKTHPRSLANARHTCFQLAMSAFHLRALGHYLDEIERWKPSAGTPDHYVITQVPAIRLSDCLDAYDGRVLRDELEREFADHPVFDLRPTGSQSNILPHHEASEDYRAKRTLAAVLKNIDPRLQAPARTMIRAATDVMSHHARTPWGWSVYYSEAFTYVWKPVYYGRAGSARAGGSSTEPEPETPSTPRGAGSTGGGPTTGGAGR